MAATEIKTPTYGNWRRPTSRGLMGLGSVGTALLLGGLMFMVLVVMASGLIAGLAVGAVLGLVLLLLLTRDGHGRNLVSRIGSRLGWWATRSGRSHLYRSGPLGMSRWGTCQLPGVAAQLSLVEGVDAYGRPFAMLHCPSTGHYAVPFATEPDGMALVDPEQVNAWVANWGAYMARLGDEPGLAGASVTVETAPDTGWRLRQEVANHMDPEAPEFARRMLAETVEQYPVGSSTVRAYVTLTFDAATRLGGRRRKAEEMIHDLASRLPQLTAELQATGAGAARPLSATELCEVVRIAYNPGAAVLIDDARARGEEPDLRWPEVGPAGAEAAWDHYRHDDAVSTTWFMTQAPRGNVQSSILSRLLASHRDVARKRVTLLLTPIDPARAAAIVESDLRAAEFRVQSTTKPTAADLLAVRAASATAGEEASGAGLVDFAMIITATVLDPADAADARAAVDSLSATARLRTRIAAGSQASAFAFGLPLGLLPDSHVAVPSELQERL